MNRMYEVGDSVIYRGGKATVTGVIEKREECYECGREIEGGYRWDVCRIKFLPGEVERVVSELDELERSFGDLANHVTATGTVLPNYGLLEEMEVRVDDSQLSKS